MALELEYISKDLYREVRAIADETRRMLNGYIAYLKQCKQGETEPGSQLAASDSYLAHDDQPSRRPTIGGIAPHRLTTSVP